MKFTKRIACILIFCLLFSVGVYAENEQVSITAEQNKNIVEISGNAVSPGQAVGVQVLTPGASAPISLENILYQNQTEAGESGAFCFRFAMPSDAESGDYPVKVTYEDGTSTALTLSYKSATDVSQAFTELAGVTDAAALLDVFKQYASAWNFNLSLYDTLAAADQESVAAHFIDLNGCASATPQEAAQLFDSAVIATAASCFNAANYKELVTGTYQSYTGFTQTAAYQKFGGRLDDAAISELAAQMTGNTYKSAQDAKNAFEAAVALYIINHAQTWYDIKDVLDTASGVLGVNASAISAQENAGDVLGGLMGKTYTLASFKDAYNSAVQSVQSGVQIIFKDAAEQTLWANDSINALYAQGIVSGVGDGLFDPNGNVSREQFAKMIVSMLGDVEYILENPFTDVVASEWYAPFVCTAKAIGIVNGITETEFGVFQNITREQMAAMIYRAGTLMGYAPSGQPKQFTDANMISDYAKQAIDQLTAGGVIGGMPDGSFQPAATATRAEAACMIHNMMRAVQHTTDLQTGLEPLTGVDIMVSLQENYNNLAEKDYPDRDLTSFYGWYFVPNGSSIISAVEVPGGKTYEIPMTAAQKRKNAKDIGMRLSADNSNQSAFFDTHPFLMSDKTSGKMRIEMNLYLHTESSSSDYKVFDTLFMTELDNNIRLEMPFIYFAGDTGVYYYDQNLNGVRCGSYTPDKWTHVMIELDPQAKSYSISLDGVKIAQNIPFNNTKITWDGSSPAPGYKKIRLRTGVVPDAAGGTSYAILDDFLWARYTDAPMILLQTDTQTANSIALTVPENIDVSSLEGNITLQSNGTDIAVSGSYANGVYTLTPASPLVSGNSYAVQIERLVCTTNGTSVGTTYTIPFIAK